MSLGAVNTEYNIFVLRVLRIRPDIYYTKTSFGRPALGFSSPKPRPGSMYKTILSSRQSFSFSYTVHSFTFSSTKAAVVSLCHPGTELT